jgi:hypothetical protein
MRIKSDNFLNIVQKFPRNFTSAPNRYIRFLFETFFSMLLIFNEVRGRITNSMKQQISIGNPRNRIFQPTSSEFRYLKKRAVTTENVDE